MKPFLTAIVILFEMTRDYESILPLMLAVMVSTVVSKLLRRETIYTIKLVRRGVRLAEEEVPQVLENVAVQHVMDTTHPSVRNDATTEELTELFSSTGRTGFPVVDADLQLVGVVVLSDLARANGAPGTKVEDICTHDVVTAWPDQSVHDALAQLGGMDVGRIPVVTRGSEAKVLGVLGRRDIVKAYTEAVMDSSGNVTGSQGAPARRSQPRDAGS